MGGGGEGEGGMEWGGGWRGVREGGRRERDEGGGTGSGGEERESIRKV